MWRCRYDMKSELLSLKKSFNLVGKYWKLLIIIKESVFKWQVKIIYFKQNFYTNIYRAGCCFGHLLQWNVLYLVPLRFKKLHSLKRQHLSVYHQECVSFCQHLISPIPLPFPSPNTCLLSSFGINIHIYGTAKEEPVLKICKVKMAWLKLEWLNRKCFPKSVVFQHFVYRLISKIQMG